MSIPVALAVSASSIRRRHPIQSNYAFGAPAVGLTASALTHRQRRQAAAMDAARQAASLEAAAPSTAGSSIEDATMPAVTLLATPFELSDDFAGLACSEGLMTVAGFGSLLSETSARSTFPDLLNFRQGRLRGWRRVFAHQVGAGCWGGRTCFQKSCTAPAASHVCPSPPLSRTTCRCPRSTPPPGAVRYLLCTWHCPARDARSEQPVCGGA